MTKVRQPLQIIRFGKKLSKLIIHSNNRLTETGKSQLKSNPIFGSFVETEQQEPSDAIEGEADNSLISSSISST